MQSLVTSRYVLQAFLDELLEYDRDIAVARNIQVGAVADALHHLLRATAPDVHVADDRPGVLTESEAGTARRSRRRRAAAAQKRLRSRARA